MTCEEDSWLVPDGWFLLSKHTALHPDDLLIASVSPLSAVGWCSVINNKVGLKISVVPAGDQDMSQSSNDDDLALLIKQFSIRLLPIMRPTNCRCIAAVSPASSLENNNSSNKVTLLLTDEIIDSKEINLYTFAPRKTIKEKNKLTAYNWLITHRYRIRQDV